MPITNAEQKMKELEQKYGTPRQGTLGLEYFKPSGVTETYSESGDFMAKTLPAHYTNEYSPYDQKELEKLYKARSQAAQNPELTPDEKQAAFDKIDARIGRIPRLSPMMKEPTAQQKAEANIVTINGVQGFFDTKSNKFNPIEPDATKQKQQENYDKDVDVFIKQMMSDKSTENLPYDVKVRRAKQMADEKYGLNSGSKNVGIIPQLEELWVKQMNAVDYVGLSRIKGNKLTYKDLKDAREKYVVEAMKDYRMTSQEALFDFMNRIQQAQDNPDDPYYKILPKLHLSRKKSIKGP